MKIKTFWMLAVLMPVFFGCSDQNDHENDHIYTTAPEGAIVLFDGSDFSHWVNCDGGDVRWKIVDGVMEVVPDSAWGCQRIQGTMTREEFKDFHLYLEFKLPDNENTNSGIYIQKRYELQVNFSHNVEPDNIGN